MAENNYGYLVVAVTTANGTVPIEGARVRVLERKGKTLTVIKNLRTDQSGVTPSLSLPCPPKSDSQTPDNEDVFGSYTVQTDCEGFGSVQNNGVQIFEGVKSIQNVSMVPSQRGENKEVVYDNERQGL